MATRTWTGLSGTTSNWTDAANWDVLPVAGDDLVFAGSLRTSPVNTFAANTSFSSLSFAAAASAFSLSGAAITLAGNINNNSGNTQVIGISMIVSAVRNITMPATSDVTLSGDVSGAGAFTISGDGVTAAGTVLLIGNMSCSGNWTVNSGSLKLNSADRIATTSSLTIASPGVFDINSSNETLNGLSGAGRIINSGSAATLTVGASNGTSTFSGVISGSINFVKSGTGTITLSSNASTFTGTVTASVGVLKAGASTNIVGGGTTGPFGAVANAITVLSGAALDCGGFYLSGYTTAITINGPGIDATTGALFNSTGTGDESVRFITLGSDASIGSNGSRLDIGRSFTSSINTGAFTLTKIGTSVLGLMCVTTGWVGIIVNTGELRLEGTNNAAGTATITLNPGTILSSWGARTLANTLTVTNGRIQCPNQTATYTGTVTVTGTLTIDPLSGRTITFSNVISGTGGVSKVNAGLAVFSNTNTYTGTTAISTGQLRVTGSLAAGSAVTVSGSGTLIGAGTVNGTVLVQTGGGVSPGATGTTIATLTLGATTLDSGSTYTVNLDSAASPNSDRISTGALSLGGTLSINSLSNYRVGKSYLIASAPSITGIFAGLPQGTLIPFGGRLFMIQYTATDVLLRDTRNKNTFLPLFN